MSNPRKRGSNALEAVLALAFAFATLALCLWALALPAAETRAPSPFEPRPDFLDKPHRHQALPPVAPAAR